MNENLKNISISMIDRYSTRYKKLGRNVKTLGWGSTDQQQYRFEQTLEVGVNFEGKHLLDIGCGFGDYYDFLKKHPNPTGFASYTGYDLNPDLIQSAQEKTAQNKDCSFKIDNILEDKATSPIADIGIMLGVLNLNLKNQYDNYAYSKRIIKNALSLVKEALIVDFLSTELTPSYPKEDFVFYHNPIQMLEFGLTLSSNAVLKHDYTPIPQKEFMLIIYK